mmetsp:Transcript_53570/g.129033  ORF Transcript_53570/g.129033 Transcript_53570/m.129033 type:complete len:283 (+) Transcript_53570:184-1032(+)
MREHHVQQIRPVVIEHPLNRRPQILLSHDALRRDAEPLRDGDEVREDVLLVLRLVVLHVRRAEVGVSSVRAVEPVLPLHDHAQVLVVQDEHLHREVLRVQRGELLDVHDEGSVAVDVDDDGVGPRGGGANRGGEAEAHGAQATRREPVSRLVKLVMLRRPHLMLPDAGGNDSLAFGHLAQELHGVLRDDVVVRLGVRERELGPLLRDVRPPLGKVQLGLVRSDYRVESPKRGLDVGEHRAVRLLVLTNLRRVDVDVHDGRPRGERVELSGDAIVEADAKREE